MSGRLEDAGPMDYRYENETGPVDVNSPFLTATRRFGGSAFGSSVAPHPKRSRSEFESPSRPQSSFPSLRAPGGQTTLFSNLPRPVSPNKPLPATPNFDAFRTPRKPDFELLSSGGETPNTPDTVEPDSEATPELNIRSTRDIRSLSPSKGNKGNMSPKKRRDSWFSRIIHSPKREAITTALKPYSNKAEKRVTKRRARTKLLSKTVDLTGDSDSDKDTKKKDNKPSSGFHGTLSSYLRLVEDHPNAPTILITYLQLLSNFLLILFSMYVVSSLWSGILGDVDKGVRETQSETMLEVLSCKQDWISFRCEERPDRTRDLCETLAKCISKDPEKIARAQVSARTFAKIINDFAEPISLKAMLFYLSLFSIFWYSTNATWNGLRNKLAQEYQQHNIHPPATPARHPSNGMMLPPNTPYSAAHHGYMYGHVGFNPGMEPGPSGFPSFSSNGVSSSQETAVEAGASPQKIEFG